MFGSHQGVWAQTLRERPVPVVAGILAAPTPLQRHMLLLVTTMHFFTQGSITLVQPCHLVLISVFLWPWAVREKNFKEFPCVDVHVYVCHFFNAVNIHFYLPVWAWFSINSRWSDSTLSLCTLKFRIRMTYVVVIFSEYVNSEEVELLWYVCV